MESSAPKLRKRKAVEYTEDDDIDNTPKKKTKIVSKPKTVPKVTSVKSAKSIKDGENSKELSKAKETKVSKSKVAKTAVEHDEDNNFYVDNENVSNEVWNEAEMLAQVEKIPLQLAKNLIGLLTEGCTLPFIARYRKTVVDNLMPDRLQELHESYENITQLKKKVKSVIETLKKSKKLTPDIQKGILSARNLSELDLIVSYFCLFFYYSPSLMKACNC
uniref:Tex-like protein N-terminal domain-containing protein n=1 Tax=Heliothis virescens TaxID=7102 RepID=A0A2A4JCH1_HELVI